MKIQDLMHRGVRCCHLQDSLSKAARHLSENGCWGVPVVDDEGALLGMISVRDLCAATSNLHSPPMETPAALALSRGVHVVGADDSIETAQHLMQTHGVRVLVVVDDGDRVLGLLTIDHLASLVERQMRLASTTYKADDLVRTMAASCR